MVRVTPTLLSLAFAGLLPAADPAGIMHPLALDQATSATSGWKQPRANASITGRPLTIHGVTYAQGIGTHAPGSLVFPLGGIHHRFTAQVGVDDRGSAGSVVFSVRVDGNEVFTSGVMRCGDPAKAVDIDLAGAKELALLAADGGDGIRDDHADWAEPRIDAVLAAAPVPGYSTAGFFPVPETPRRVLSFNPGWRFLRADAPGAEVPGFDDSAWVGANLPHGLEVLGENASGGRNYQGLAWYRKRFPTPAGEGRIFLYFEGVMGKCTVWLNGSKAGEHFGGYLPLAIDATALLKPVGQDNLIAVRADNRDDPAYPPGKPQADLDFTYLGGIYRDTYLIRTGGVHVTLPELSATEAGGGVFVGTRALDGQKATVEVRTEVANTTTAPAAITLRTTIETPTGQVIGTAEQTLTVPAGKPVAAAQPLTLHGAHLWHPDDPYLHFVRTEVLENGVVKDSLRTRFGIRLYDMRVKEGLFINGRPFTRKLNGVNRHQDYGSIGNALPNSGQWRDVKILRQGGVNCIRAAHYPMDPAFYDACDELGMLVTTANPGWQFFNTKNPLFEQRLYEDTRNLVRRDRNHPAMLLWETALNETPSQPPKVMAEMHRLAHAEYPFPGMYTVTDVDEAKAGGLDFYYHGSFNEPKNSFTREYGDGGEVDNFFSHNATTRVPRAWGEAPLLMQAKIRAKDLDGIFSTPPIRLGGALWCGIDHHRGYHPDPFWGGLLDQYRLPRYAYDLFRSQYDADYRLPGITTGPMVAIAHELTQVSGADITVYSNCEEVRLTWLGKDLGTRKPDAGYRALPHPPITFPAAFDYGVIKRDWRDRTGTIELVAEGLIAGRVVTRSVKPYPERSTAVRVTVDDVGIGLSADGSDLVPLRATIVDNKGVPKVLAQEHVFFTVEGPAELVVPPGAASAGVATEFGIATALLRAGLKPGVIRITAHVAGLGAGEALYASTAPALTSALDPAYMAASKAAASGQAVVVTTTAAASAGTAELQEEIQRLKRELTSKEQDLMEFRSRK